MIFTNKLGNVRNFFHTKLKRMATGVAVTACILSSAAVFARDTVLTVQGETNVFFEYTYITYQPGAGGPSKSCTIRVQDQGNFATAALILKTYAANFSDAYIACDVAQPDGLQMEISAYRP
jgi:hypothetical protein